MENNSFTKKSFQKLKSSYITSRTFDKLEKIEKVDKIPNQVDSVNLATRLIRGELEIRLTHTKICRRPSQNCFKEKLLSATSS